jgi:glutamate-ammonia-ligase adenylyltransferase
MGALVVSSDRFREYYVNEAQGWERMALLKARAIAGDDPFRARIEEEAHELAYSTPFTHDDFVQAENIRKQLSAKASPLDIKKAEGGIAELEFGIRFLQLHYGKEDRKLRTASVLEALSALHNAEVLSAEDKTALQDTYLLFRRVENRIRMMDGKGGSALPKDKAQQQELAARLKINTDLADLIATQKEKVHKFYQATLAKVLDLS